MQILKSDTHENSLECYLYFPQTPSYKIKTWLKDKNFLFKLTASSENKIDFWASKVAVLARTFCVCMLVCEHCVS